MYKHSLIAGLILLILPHFAKADWQVQRIDALKQNVVEVKMSMNSSGEAVIAFTQNDTAQTPNRRLYATLFDPASETFTTPVVVDAGLDETADKFGVCIDEQGNVTVTFTQLTWVDTASHLFLNQYTPGKGWTGPYSVFAVPWPGGFFHDPQIGFLNSDAVVLFFYFDYGTSTYILKVYREPGSFVPIYTGPGIIDFVLATNGMNKACIAYGVAPIFPIRRIYSSRYGYPGNSWSLPELVDRDTLAININPSLSLDPDGNGFLVFGYNTSPDTLFVNVLDTLLGWTGPVMIAPGAGDGTEEWDVATDDSGNAMVVYNKWASGLQGFSRYYQSGTGWSPSEIFTQDVGGIDFSAVSFDSAGNAVAIFESNTFVGANGFTVGKGWGVVDTVYAGDGSFRQLDIKAYREMNAVAAFLCQTDSTRLYAAIGTLTGVEETDARIQKPEVRLQIYPNPFSKTTRISFVSDTDTKHGHVSLKIYNLSGRLIHTFNHLTNQPVNQVTWNAKGVPSGIYFLRMETEDFKQTQKLILLR